MKTKMQYLLVAAVLLLSGPEVVSGMGIPVQTKISHITVFLKGAQITRRGTATLAGGAQTLSFRSLAYDIQSNSIQVKGQGYFTILSVKHRTNYLDESQESPELQGLRKKLVTYNRRKENLTVQMQVLKGEESMMEKNQTVTGQNGLSISALTNAMDFYRKKMTDIKTRLLDISRNLQDLGKKIKQVNLQINELTQKQKMAAGEILVTVRAEKPGKAVFVLSYYTGLAGWRPEYDVRVDDITKEVKIGYKAFIKQTTGEAWNKIPVTLSTGNPAIGGNKPELYPWFLDFRSERAYKYNSKSKGMPVMAKMEAPAAMTTAAYTHVSQQQTTTAFEITLPYTIPSENTEQAVLVKNIMLPAVYAYYIVPKLDHDAFLIASVTGWKKQDFLSGKMNLFMKGNFVGTSFLDVSTTRDTLRLTLGRDKRIKVARKKQVDFTRKQILGNNIIETHSWKITVMNTKKVPVHLFIEDQIPVSKRKEIEVEPLELSGAQLKENTGKCIWDVHLRPQASKAFILKFLVKYPKGKTVYID